MTRNGSCIEQKYAELLIIARRTFVKNRRTEIFHTAALHNHLPNEHEMPLPDQFQDLLLCHPGQPSGKMLTDPLP